MSHMAPLTSHSMFWAHVAKTGLAATAKAAAIGQVDAISAATATSRMAPVAPLTSHSTFWATAAMPGHPLLLWSMRSRMRLLQRRSIGQPLLHGTFLQQLGVLTT